MPYLALAAALCVLSLLYYYLRPAPLHSPEGIVAGCLRLHKDKEALLRLDAHAPRLRLLFNRRTFLAVQRWVDCGEVPAVFRNYMAGCILVESGLTKDNVRHLFTICGQLGAVNLDVHLLLASLEFELRTVTVDH